MQLEVTGLWAGLLGLFGVLLSLSTVRVRRTKLMTYGDGGDKELEAVARVSYIPFDLH